MARVAVFAYHSVGCECLKALLPFGDEIAGVVTHRDAPGENTWFDSVADTARDHGLPLYFAEDMSRSQLLDRAAIMAPDLIYSFYYRDILPDGILRLPSLGAFNLHGSLLPRYRGRCPVNWVILNREAMTGVTLHWMVREPDAGDIVAQKEIAVDPRETALSLFGKMIPAAAALVRDSHPLIREGRATRRPQDPAAATVYPGRRPSDGEIDWFRSARDIDALVRAVTKPYPGAFTCLDGRKVLIWETLPEEGGTNRPPGSVLSVEPLVAAAGEGVLRILEAEYENGEDIVLNGRTVFRDMHEGEVFGRCSLSSRRENALRRGLHE